MPIPWEGVGLLLAAFVTALGKSCYNGRLRRSVIEPLLADKRSAKQAHDRIPEVKETVECIQHTVESIDEKVDDVKAGQREVRETVAYLHREDLSDDPLARDRLDVDADSDFLRGGDG